MFMGWEGRWPVCWLGGSAAWRCGDRSGLTVSTELLLICGSFGSRSQGGSNIPFYFCCLGNVCARVCTSADFSEYPTPSSIKYVNPVLTEALSL